MPGSLGVESIVEAVQCFALHTGLTREFRSPRFGIACDVQTVWKYRGQIVEGVKAMRVEAHITSTETHDETIVLRADASLWRDGLRIYEVHDLALTVTEASPGRSGHATCALARRSRDDGVTPGHVTHSDAGVASACVRAEADVALLGPWHGDPDALAFDEHECEAVLRRLDLPLVAVRRQGRVGLASAVSPRRRTEARSPESFSRNWRLRRRGGSAMRRSAPITGSACLHGRGHGQRHRLGGARRRPGSGRDARLVRRGRPRRRHASRQPIVRIQEALPHGPYAFNLIHSPSEQALERAGRRALPAPRRADRSRRRRSSG